MYPVRNIVACRMMLLMLLMLYRMMSTEPVLTISRHKGVCFLSASIKRGCWFVQHIGEFTPPVLGTKICCSKYSVPNVGKIKQVMGCKCGSDMLHNGFSVGWNITNCSIL